MVRSIIRDVVVLAGYYFGATFEHFAVELHLLLRQFDFILAFIVLVNEEWFEVLLVQVAPEAFEASLVLLFRTWLFVLR